MVSDKALCLHLPFLSIPALFQTVITSQSDVCVDVSKCVSIQVGIYAGVKYWK